MTSTPARTAEDAAASYVEKYGGSVSELTTTIREAMEQAARGMRERCEQICKHGQEVSEIASKLAEEQGRGHVLAQRMTARAYAFEDAADEIRALPTEAQEKPKGRE